MKTVIITGATSGVGKALCGHFVKDSLVVGLARSYDRLTAMHQELGDRFKGFAVDIADSKQLGLVFGDILQQFPIVDVLINNAAVFRNHAFVDMLAADIDAIIDTNLKGTMYCSLEVARHMKKTGTKGRIINIGSVAGTHGIPLQAAYCASKYGVNGFADALAQELRTAGIGVTTICPGGIDTPLWNEQNPYPGLREELLKVEDLCAMVAYIVGLPARIILKDATIFPAIEWH